MALTFLFFLATCSYLFTQKMDQSFTFRDIQGDAYLRVSYDNDLFTFTDQNYTQGINLEFASVVLKKNPINYLLVKDKNAVQKYVFALEQLCFTPKNIKSTEIQVQDRPFAATLLFKSAIYSTDTVRNFRLVSGLDFGCIGPLAFGNEMQTTIHKATKNILPQGWRNQIANTFILNYNLALEKQIFRYRNVVSLKSSSALQVGNLYSNISLGLNSSFGLLNSAFSRVKSSRKVQIYLYTQILGKGIGYDASLQGNLFQDKSPYTISNKAIERFTLQINYGLIFQSQKAYFELGLSHLTKEFETGSSVNWGGVKLGFVF